MESRIRSLVERPGEYNKWWPECPESDWNGLLQLLIHLVKSDRGRGSNILTRELCHNRLWFLVQPEVCTGSPSDNYAQALTESFEVDVVIAKTVVCCLAGKIVCILAEIMIDPGVRLGTEGIRY